MVVDNPSLSGTENYEYSQYVKRKKESSKKFSGIVKMLSLSTRIERPAPEISSEAESNVPIEKENNIDIDSSIVEKKEEESEEIIIQEEKNEESEERIINITYTGETDNEIQSNTLLSEEESTSSRFPNRSGKTLNIPSISINGDGSPAANTDSDSSHSSIMMDHSFSIDPIESDIPDEDDYADTLMEPKLPRLTPRIELELYDGPLTPTTKASKRRKIFSKTMIEKQEARARSVTHHDLSTSKDNLPIPESILSPRSQSNLSRLQNYAEDY